ncbi:MAG: putative Ig domain-containing protein [Planctomycetales bacterium]
MHVSDWLEGIYRRLFPAVFARLGRNRRRQLRERRCAPRAPIAAWVDSLEERVLLASALGSEFLVNATVAGDQEFGEKSDRSFAVTPEGTTIFAWGTSGTGNSELAASEATAAGIVARRVDAQGNVLGGEIDVSHSPADLAGNTVVGTYGHERFVVAWESTGNALDPSGSGVFARLFSGDGTPLGDEFAVSQTLAGDQGDPTVAWLAADRFVVGWTGNGTGDSQGIFTRVFNATGAPITGELRSNQTADGVQQEPALVSLPNVGYQVVWSGMGPGDTSGIFSRPFDFDGMPLADAFRVNATTEGVQQSPALARTGDGRILQFVWQSQNQGEAGREIVGRQMLPDGSPRGNEFPVNQTTAGDQQNPVVVGYTEERFVFAWEGNGPGDADGVFVREFDRDGAPQTDERRVNATIIGSQHQPALRPYGGGYTVAWSGNGQGDASGVFLQVFGRPDTTVPAVMLSLAHDSGTSATDGVTSDPALTGSATDFGGVTRLELAHGNAAPFFDITDKLQGDGTIGLTRAQLEQLLGTPLVDGPQRFRLRAQDAAGNQSADALVEFTLDTGIPTASLDLDPATDSAPTGDRQTTAGTVTLVGQTEPNVLVTLMEAGAPAQAGADGRFSFPVVSLLPGSNPFTIRIEDLAGNIGTTAESFTRLEAGSLAGWTFSETGGALNAKGSAVIHGANVILREGDSFSATLSGDLVVPSVPSTLSFSFSNRNFDTTDPAGINDAFEAALLDANGNTLVHGIAAGRDAAFNITESQPTAAGVNVQTVGQTVKFDLSHIPGGTAARLAVRLVNNDRDVDTSVEVTPFQLVAGGLGTPIGTQFDSLFAHSVAPVRTENLTDVSGSTRLDYERTTLSENPLDLAVEVRATNLSAMAVVGPLLLVIDHLSDPAVGVVNPDGHLADGRPYVDLSSAIPGGDLVQNESTSRAQLVFRNPNGARFTYTAEVLAAVNQAPRGFDSTPVREIAAGTQYLYPALATDPEHQPLTYSLVIGPQGMAIDPATGRLTWATTSADVGNHSVTLRATDPYGLSVEQSFSLSVLEALPNRPPIFTSTPPTDAVVASPFEVLTYATGGAPAAVTAGDFGTGRVSVVTANPGDQTLGLLGGSGQGRLNATQPLNVGEPPPDYSQTAFVAPVTVDLGFLPGTYENIEREMGDVQTADVDGDGNPDLIVLVNTGSQDPFNPGNVGSVGIRLGNGDGTFHRGWESALPSVANRGSSAYAVRYADVTGDGEADLVMAQYLGQRLLVYAGIGDAMFASTPIVSAYGGSSSFMQVADFDGDLKLDAVLFENSPNGQFRTGLSVLFGDGQGGFGSEVYYAAANDNAGPGYVVDVDGVNGPDLVRLSYNDQRLEVRLNDGSGGFGVVQFSTVFAFGSNGLDLTAYTIITNPVSAYFGDFDRDGTIDAEVSTATYGLFFLRGTGAGGFGDGTATGNRANIPFGQPTGYDNFPAAFRHDGTTRDMNGDGILDVVYGNAQTAQLFVGLGRGDGTFAPQFYSAQYSPDVGVRSVRGATPTYLVNLADYNRDGVMDVLAGSQRTSYKPGGVAVILGDQPGTLRAGRAVSFNESNIAPLFVTADFNNDGVADMATISNSISVSIGHGDGTFDPFQVGIQVPAGGGEFLGGSLLAADFDRDGNMDLSWVGSDGVQGGAPPRYIQAFGLGNGAFQLMSISNIPNRIAVGRTTQEAGVAGDFNGDGHTDLAYRVTDGDTGTSTRIDVLLYDPVAKRFSLLPDATGLLGPIARNTSYYRDQSIGFADLNGDGRGEIFVHSTAIPAQGNVPAIPERLTLYEISAAPAGDAAQLFTRTVIDNPGLSPNATINSYAVHDFNRDGHLDIAAQIDNGAIVVAMGHGDFTFASVAAYLTNSNSRVFAADVTGDGIADLVSNWTSFGNFSARSLLTALPGRGDGTFGSAQQLAVSSGSAANALAVGDFNLDGVTDFATSGTRTTAEVFLAAPPGLADVESGDLNGDGQRDIVAINTGFNRVKLELGNGNDTVSRQPDLVVGASPVALELADLDGDNRLDIVTANRVGQSLTYLKNGGNGTYLRTDLPLPARPEHLAIGDLNSDGKPDLLAVSALRQSLSVIPSTLNGFGAPLTLDLGFAAADVSLADLTGDSRLDAVLTDAAGKRVLILPGHGDGTFGAARFVALNEAPERVAVADMNADGRSDLVVTLPGADRVGILFGRGSARFTTPQTIGVGDAPSALDVSDVNGDGRPDLLVTNAGDDTLSVILNRFDPANLYHYRPTATDPDGDPVTFDLDQAPGGMLYDDATGQILWAPMADQIGANSVVVQAEDGRGGEATQGFVVQVTAPLPTPPPVFASTPATVIPADGTFAYQPSNTNPAQLPLRYSLVSGPEGMSVDPTTGDVTWDPRRDGLSLDLLLTDTQTPRYVGRGRIETPDSPSLRSASVTAEGWFKFDSNNSQANLLRKKFDDNFSGVSNSSWSIQNSYGTPRAIIGETTDPAAVVNAPAPFSLGVWYHLALTFEDATRTLTLFVNGNAVGSTVAPATLQYRGEPLQIGTTENLFGTVSGVRVWSMARSASEIAADMLRDLPDTTPGLVLDYRFHEGRDSATVVDSTASHNHGGIATSFEFYNYPQRVPTLGFAGSYPVTLQVEDGRGGVGVQRFSVNVVSMVRGSAAGNVFDDRDGSGTQDAGESGLAGWTVFIDANRNGNRDDGEQGTLTDPAGHYSLTGLLTDSVPIALQSQAGSSASSPQVVAVTSGATAAANFAVALGHPGIIRGTIGADGTGAPIRGFTIFLDTNQSGYRDGDEPVAQSDLGGRYVFSDLVAGSYTVRLDVPAGWSVSTPTGGGGEVVMPAGGDVPGPAFLASPQSADASRPVFVTKPSSVATARTAYRYAAVAPDPLAGRVEFTLAVAPAGMAVDSATGVVVWTPGLEQIGAHPVLLRAANASGGVALQDFTILVGAPNTAPVITSLPPSSAIVGVPFRYVVAAQDSEQSALHFSLSLSPAGMAIDPNTGLVTWTPGSGQQGPAVAAIVVADGDGGLMQQTLALQVRLAGANGPPSIVSAGRLEAQIDRAYRGRVVASDPDGDALVFSLVAGPVGLGISPEGLLAWTPTAVQFGENAFRVRVSDGRSFDERDLSLWVRSRLTNAPPVIADVASALALAGRPFAIDLHAGDADGDPIAFERVTGPVGLSVDPQHGTLRWLPGIDQLGNHTVTVRALDPFGGFDEKTLTIAVRGAGGPPAFTSNPPTVAAVGKTYVYPVLATDLDEDPLLFSLSAAPAGMTIDAVTGVVQWTPTGGQVGSHRVIIRVADGAGGFATQAFAVAVATGVPNRPPVLDSVPPLEAVAGSPFVYTLHAADPEGGTVAYALRAGPASLTVDLATGVISWIPSPADVGRAVLVLTATDPGGAAAVQSFEVDVFASNNAPQVRSTAPASVPAGGMYRYDVLADDLDREPLSYELVSGPAGMTIDSLGRLRWQTALDTPLGGRSVTVVVHDGRGGSDSQTFGVTVRSDTAAPRVAILIANGTLYPWSTDPARVRVSGTDDVGVTDIAVTVDGRPVSLGSDGTFSVFYSGPGGGRIEALATDAAGNRGRALAQVRMRSGTEDGTGNISDAPTVAITSVNDGDQVLGFVQVIGTAASQDLTEYVLSYRRADELGFHEIRRGNTSITNGLLGTWDTTLLENDDYVLKVEASDQFGNFAAVERQVAVAGNFKLGNFRLSFADMSIPVAGIPITIARSYDTLRAGRDSDFGYGWRLEFRNVDLRTSVGRSGLEDIGIYAPFKVGARVSLTLPGGERQNFTFTPDLRVLPGFGSENNLTIATPRFTPDRGVTSRLSVGGGNLLVNQYGELFASGGIPWNPASPDFGGGFTLTLADGTQYAIDGANGQLNATIDRNGNRLTFSDRGVTSASGLQVQFERDARGRIVAVSDPAGHSIRYRYSPTGDLIGVTDRDQNSTRFEYLPDRPHYLDQIIDPLGRTGARITYGADGRMSAVVDARNNGADIQYDPDRSRQTLVDALGNPSIVEFDARGNIVLRIDALGGVTRRTFDANDRELSITDPLGRRTSRTYDESGNVLTITDPLGRVNRQTFNSFGQVVSATDSLGRTAGTTYDSRGNALTVTGFDGTTIVLANDRSGNATALTGASGNTGTLEYDLFGRISKINDPRGQVSTSQYDTTGNLLSSTTTMPFGSGTASVSIAFEYNNSGKLTNTTDAAGGITRHEYDVMGNRVRTVDSLNHAQSQVFDETNRPIEATYADGLKSQTAYDALGRVAATTDRGGRVTRFVYDAMGRPTETIFPDATPQSPDDNPRVQAEYDLAGQVVATIDELGHRTERFYDLAGRLIRVRDALGGETTFAYDLVDRLTARTDPLGRTSRFEYDRADHLTQVLLPDGRQASQQFDALGRRIAATDEAGVTTHFEYDRFDRLIAVVDALGGRTEFEYNQAGDLIRQTDANGHVTQFEYDPIGRQINAVLPLGQRSATSYDLQGNVVASTDLNGQVARFEYDSLGRLAAQRLADGSSLEYTYTPSGRRKLVTDARGVTSYDYDERDRLIHRTEPDGQQIRFAYDAVGNRLSMTTSAGTVHYAYDPLNRLAAVVDPDGGITTYTYDAAGNRVGVERPDGTIETRQYDLRDRLTLITETLPGGALLSRYAYTRDAAGHVTRVEELGGRQVDYAYDAAYRLVQELIVDPSRGNRTIGYTYDAVGNRQLRIDSVDGTAAYVYDANDRLTFETDSVGATWYTYDNQGNLLVRARSNGEQTVYQWNASQKLVEIQTNEGGVTHRVEYRYDSDGLRVAQITDTDETRYLVDASIPNPEAVLEYTPTGVIVASSVVGAGPISRASGGERTFYHADGHSGVRLTTNAAGVVQATYAYDAFGRLLSAAPDLTGLLLYRGEYRNLQTGLDYLRTRWLDTDSGRFLGRDPFAGTLGNPVSLHDYLYAASDPVNNSDPTGLSTYAEELTGLALRGILIAIPAAIIATPILNYTLTGHFSWEHLAENVVTGVAIGGLVAISPLAGLIFAAVGVAGSLTVAQSVFQDSNASWDRKGLATALVFAACFGQSRALNKFIEAPRIARPRYLGYRTVVIGTADLDGRPVAEWSAATAITIDQRASSSAAITGTNINDINFVSYFGRTVREFVLPNVPFLDRAIPETFSYVNGLRLAGQLNAVGASAVYGVTAAASEGELILMLEALQARGWQVQMIPGPTNGWIFTANR